MSLESKQDTYQKISSSIQTLISGQKDLISILSTVVCELHNGIDYFHWTGFYRVTSPGNLHVGPYQGGHGCLYIPFDRGICGQVASSEETLIIGNVNLHSNHIACSTSTLSEIVVPLFDRQNQLLAVLDVDSDLEDAFDEVDGHHLEAICEKIRENLP